MPHNMVDTDRLVEPLLELRDLHEQLVQAATRKQRGMRSGDMDGVESWSARETFLVERIKTTDEQRREATEDLARELGMTEPATVSQLAGRLAEPHRSRLLALAGAIRASAEQVYQINQINDAVTREILQCFAQMQRQYTQTQCDIGLYDPNGQRRLVDGVSILDAVG